MDRWKRNQAGKERCLPGRIGGAALGALLLALAGTAHGELGGNVASVRNEARVMQGALRVTTLDAYEVHELRAPDGAVVRQFLDKGGKVFAVTWQSHGPANLQALLGSYYPTYRSLGATRLDLHHAALSSPGLVVEVGGVLHTFTGRAYLPDRLPSNVSAARIQ